MREEELRIRVYEQLVSMADPDYRRFQSQLIPTVDPKTIIGVRMPELRRFAKVFAKEPGALEYLNLLPHQYYDENNFHACLIEGIRDYDRCMREVNRFLPFVDNWATCDLMAPAVFAKHKEELLVQIRCWIRSEHTYTVRYGLGMLMRHFLEDDFKEEYLELAASVRSEEYYVRMMTAWYFATALAKQYDQAIRCIEGRILEPWTHNKAIQKARESRRITREQKEYLRKLKF